MTVAHVKGEVKKPAVKVRRIAVSKAKPSFEAALHQYASERGLTDVSSAMKAASGTRLSPRTVIRRCAVLSSRAYVRAKPNESTK